MNKRNLFEKCLQSFSKKWVCGEKIAVAIFIPSPIKVVRPMGYSKLIIQMNDEFVHFSILLFKTVNYF